MLLTVPHVPMLTLGANGIRWPGICTTNDYQASLAKRPKHPDMGTTLTKTPQIGSLAARNSFVLHRIFDFSILHIWKVCP